MGLLVSRYGARPARIITGIAARRVASAARPAGRWRFLGFGDGRALEKISGQPGRASTRLNAIGHAVDTLDVLDRAAYARQLGLVRARLGRSDAALDAFERSERLTREVLGEHDPRTQPAMLARARMLAWRSRGVEAGCGAVATRIGRETDDAPAAFSTLPERIERVAAARRRGPSTKPSRPVRNVQPVTVPMRWP
jgi:hypothetical protein